MEDVPTQGAASRTVCASDAYTLLSTLGSCEDWWYSRDGEAEDFANAVVASPNGSRLALVGTENEGWQRTSRAFVTSVTSSTGAVEWDATLSAAYRATFLDAAFSPDGARLFVSGAAADSQTNAIVRAYGAENGSVLWTRRSAATDSAFSTIAVSPNGERVAAGGTRGYSSLNALVQVMNATNGALLWTVTYAGPGGGTDRATAIEWAPDGGTVYVFMEGSVLGAGQDALVYALNGTSGAYRWIARLTSSGHDRPAGFAIHPDGALFASAALSTGSIVSRIDPANGQLTWTTPLRGTAGSLVLASDTIVASAGLNGTIALTRLDPLSGSEIWHSSAQGVSAGRLDRTLALSVDGMWIAVAGERGGVPGFYYDIAVAIVDAADGTTKWNAGTAGRIGIVNTDVNDRARAVTFAGERVVVTGEMGFSEPGDSVTVAWNIGGPSILP